MRFKNCLVSKFKIDVGISKKKGQSKSNHISSNKQTLTSTNKNQTKIDNKDSSGKLSDF